MNETTKRCACLSWARTDPKVLTHHHKNCPHYDPEGDAKFIVSGLIAGIEAWAADENGVHPECWGAYCRAKIFIGVGGDA